MSSIKSYSSLGLFSLGVVSGILALHLVAITNWDGFVSAAWTDFSRAVPLALLFYFAGALFVTHGFSIPHKLEYFTIGFVVRVFLCVITFFVYQLDDERHFHQMGMVQHYGLFSFKLGSGYFHITNVLYEIFGSSMLLGKLFNALIGSVMPFFVYDLCQKNFRSSKIGWIGFAVTMFFPPFLVFSSLNLKEIGTAFLLVLTFWFLIVPLKVSTRVIGILGTVLFLLWYRGATWGLIGMIGVFVYALFGKEGCLGPVERVSRPFRIPLFILLGVAIWQFLGDPILHQIETAFRPKSMAQFTNSQASVMYFIDQSRPNSPQNSLVLLLRGIFTPSPFRFLFDYHLQSIVEALTMISFYILVPFGIIGLLANGVKGSSIAYGTVIMCVLILSSVAIVVGADPYRHKISVMGLLAILFAGGVGSEVVGRYKWILYVWFTSAASFTILWAWVRLEGL